MALKKILVGIDFSPYTLPTLNFAKELATSLNAELILVNVINRRTVDSAQQALLIAGNDLFANFVEDKLADHRVRMEELVKQAGCESNLNKILIKIGVPYEEILTVIKEEDADLLVLGIKGRSNIADVIVGSTAHKLYRRCQIPLLSLRCKPNN